MADRYSADGKTDLIFFSELGESGFDRTDGPSVTGCDLRDIHAGIVLGEELRFLLGAPCAACIDRRGQRFAPLEFGQDAVQSADDFRTNAAEKLMAEMNAKGWEVVSAVPVQPDPAGMILFITFAREQ